MSWSTFPFVLTSESLIYAFRYAGGSSPGNTSACLSCYLSPSVSLCMWEKKIITCPSSTSRSTDLGIESGEWEWICSCNWSADFLFHLLQMYIYPDLFQGIDCKNTLDLFWDWTLPNAFKPFGFTDANSLRVLCTCHLPFSSSLCVLPFLLYVLFSSILVFYFGREMERKDPEWKLLVFYLLTFLNGH